MASQKATLCRSAALETRITLNNQSSVVIKLKLENCLNVLKIVSKEPVDILLLIKD